VPGEVLGRLPPGTPVPGGIDGCVTGAGHSWFTVISSMFMHGGWLHLIGNMWFLWVFGNNIEDSMGRIRFVVFYLTTGLAAAATQALMNPGSAIPMVGASGAISGVMGAYIVLYPRVRVHLLIFLGIFITRIAVPAFWMLGYWFLLQLLGGLPSVAREGGGVAFFAHAGGFVAGMLLVHLFKNPKLVAQRMAYNLP
jgi:membrane associated rhomboid family serine protease